jgi:hypothetical protein
MDSTEPTNKVRSRIFFILTNLVSIICLVWTLRGANLGDLRREVVHLNWSWVGASIAFSLLVPAWQAWRWILVLKPVTDVSLWDAGRAIYVGLFADKFLPLHAGEIIRCYLLGIWTEIPVSVTLASAVIERIFDGVWLVICLFLTMRAMALPSEVVAGAGALVVLLLISAALVGLAMFWKQQTLDYILGARWLHGVHVLIEDLHLIGHSRYLYYAAIVSLPNVLIQALPIYALLRAYKPTSELPMAVAFVLMVVQRLGSVPPQAPGNLGIPTLMIKQGLRLFGVPVADAQRFSLIWWAFVTLPILLAGFIAVMITGARMGELHKNAKAHMSRKKDKAEAPVLPVQEH